VLRIAASAILLTLLVRLAIREDFSGVLSRINAPEVGLLLLGFAGIHLGGLWKWRLLVRAADAALPFVYAAQCYATGLFGNIFLPSNIGGDMLSTGMAMRRTENKVGVIMGTVASRALDLTALIAITAAGVLHPRTWGTVSLNAAKMATVVALGILVAVAAKPYFRIPAFVPYRWKRGLVNVRRVLRSMAAKPITFAAGFATSLILQTSLLLLNFWVGTLCGLHVPVTAWLFAWPVAKLIAFIPVSQGGFGTREFALAGLLAPFSAKPELVIAVGLVWDVLLVMAGLLGGLTALVLSRFSGVPERELTRSAPRRGTA
jgi:uncharacterized protein (TIRG00374 family)